MFLKSASVLEKSHSFVRTCDLRKVVNKSPSCEKKIKCLYSVNYWELVLGQSSPRVLSSLFVWQSRPQNSEEADHGPQTHERQ